MKVKKSKILKKGKYAKIIMKKMNKKGKNVII